MVVIKLNSEMQSSMKHMEYLIYILIVFIAGAVLPIQVGLNHKMGKAIAGAEYASFISFVVGAIVLLVYLLFIKQDFSTITQALQVKWYVWLAGLLGAFYVTSVIILAPKLGIALTFGLVVAGQMTLSLILDHFGLLGMEVKPINWLKILGVLFLIGGVIILRKA